MSQMFTHASISTHLPQSRRQGSWPRPSAECPGRLVSPSPGAQWGDFPYVKAAPPFGR